MLFSSDIWPFPLMKHMRRGPRIEMHHQLQPKKTELTLTTVLPITKMHLSSILYTYIHY